MHRLIRAFVVHLWQNRFYHDVTNNVTLDCADTQADINFHGVNMLFCSCCSALKRVKLKVP